MCYPKPGPRCSAHALKAYERAREHWQQEETSEAYDQFRRAEKDLDMTPLGQKMLRARIAGSQDPEEQRKYRDRMEYGQSMRAWTLHAMHQDDRGDVEQSHREEFVPTQFNPVPVPKMRQAIQSLGLGSVHISKMKAGYIVHVETLDAEYRIDFNDDGSVLAFKEYDDDDDLLTSAQSSVVGHLEPSSDERVYAEQVKKHVERLQDPSVDWDADEHAARFTYFGEASGDINGSLRAGTLSPQLTRTLDRVMSSHVLKEDTVVYSGIRTQGKDELHQQIKDGSFIQAGYLSTSTKESVARGFAGGGNYRGALLKMTLPAGTRCHDAQHHAEHEITLPRNFDLSKAEWEFLG